MAAPRQTRSLGPLIELVHHRWNIPVLAQLERQSGAKFVTLANSLGVSRASLSASLGDLMDQSLVRRNPGYGHPMRPEYLLTPKGQQIGKQCLRLARLVERRNEADVAYRKWTLPMVAAIGGGLRRFNELRSILGAAATPRAVTLSLKSMLAEDWAERSLIDDYPPTAAYALRAKGRRVLDCLSPLLSA